MMESLLETKHVKDRPPNTNVTSHLAMTTGFDGSSKTTSDFWYLRSILDNPDADNLGFLGDTVDVMVSEKL